MDNLKRQFKHFDPARCVTLFADASWCHKTKAYGWAFWISYGCPTQRVRLEGGGAEIHSSQQAEFIALFEGLKYIENHLDVRDKFVVVRSDCQGALGRIQPLLDDLVNFHGATRAYSRHIKAHSGRACDASSVNAACDRRAKTMMRRFREHNLSEALQESA